MRTLCCCVNPSVTSASTTSLLVEHLGRASSSTIALLTPSGERSIIYVPMKSGRTDEATLRDALRRSRCICLMPNDADRLAQVARIAREESTLAAMDLEQAVAGDPAAMKSPIAHADVVFFNEAGFIAVSGGGRASRPWTEIDAADNATGSLFALRTLEAIG